MSKLAYYIVFIWVCVSLGCNTYSHMGKSPLSKPQYIEAHSGLFTHNSFYINRKYRDIHNHNVSWDTLSGIIVQELVSYGSYRDEQSYCLCSPCREIIFVTDSFMSENIIDTLSFVSHRSPISFRDTFCSITKKWTSRGGESKCDFSADSLMGVVYSFYKNKTNHQKIIHSLFSFPNISTSLEYIYEPQKQNSSSHQFYYIVYTAQIIGMTAWNVEAADFDNEYIQGGVRYRDNYMEEEAHKIYPKRCWYNRYYPPPDFFKIAIFDTICPVSDKHIKKLALKNTDITRFIPSE